MCKPGSITPHTKFKAEVYVLTKEEGGRHTPFFKGYRPQFYFRTTDVTGVAELPEGVEMVMPGDNVSLIDRAHHAHRHGEGLRFAIREGGRTVGRRITEIRVVEFTARVGRELSASLLQRRDPGFRARQDHHAPAVHRVQARNYTTHEEQEEDRPESWSSRSTVVFVGSTPPHKEVKR